MRIAFYARVSSEEQVQGYSIDAQLRAGRELAQSKGAEFVPYVEEGRSARTEDIRKRPVFKQVMDDALARRVDVVAVHKLDRFSRNLRLLLDSLDRLGKAGVSFVSLTEQIDYSTPSGRLFLTMLGGLAQWYSDNLSFETKKGKAERKAQGLYNGLLPFGVVKGANGIPIADTQEFEVEGRTTNNHEGLVLAFQECVKGASDANVARLLNRNGFRTTGNRGKNLWTKDSIRMVLVNRFYVGELPDGNGCYVPAKHEPLIDLELFDAAQDARLRNRRAELCVPSRKTVYSLTGVARCYYCQGRLHAAETTHGRRRITCYNRGQGKDCKQRSAFLDLFEKQIEEYLEAFCIPDDFQARLLQMHAKMLDTYDDQQKQKANLDAELERLKKLYKWGDIAENEYLAERERLQAELKRFTPQNDHGKKLERLAQFLRSVATAWRKAEQPQRNQLVRMLFEEVWIKDLDVIAVKPRAPLEEFFSLDLLEREPDQASSLVGKWRKRRDSLSHLPDCTRLFPVVASDPQPSIPPQKRPKLPPTLWAEIETKVKAGHSLRALAREYGVSHEAIRQTVRAAAMV